MGGTGDQRNAVWLAQYYGQRIAERFTTVPFWAIEKRLLGRLHYERLQFYQRHLAWPHLHKPRSFSEKTVHRKLFDANPIFPMLSDKWAVRSYVSEKVGGDILNEVFAVAEDPATLPFDKFPDRFVLKATHGSGTNVFVTDKASIDREEIAGRCNAFLARDFGAMTNEAHYASIPRRIIAERFLDDGSGEHVPLDYKFFVFNGRCKVVQLVRGRFRNASAVFYDRNWVPLPFTVCLPRGTPSERPAKLDDMIAVAEALAGKLDFARIDLYLLKDGRIVFGEITLVSWAGWEPFTPVEWDFRLGAMWE